MTRSRKIEQNLYISSHALRNKSTQRRFQYCVPKITSHGWASSNSRDAVIGWAAMLSTMSLATPKQPSRDLLENHSLTGSCRLSLACMYGRMMLAREHRGIRMKKPGKERRGNAYYYILEIPPKCTVRINARLFY